MERWWNMSLNDDLMGINIWIDFPEVQETLCIIAIAQKVDYKCIVRDLSAVFIGRVLV